MNYKYNDIASHDRYYVKVKGTPRILNYLMGRSSIILSLPIMLLSVALDYENSEGGRLVWKVLIYRKSRIFSRILIYEEKYESEEMAKYRVFEIREMLRKDDFTFLI